MNRYSVAKYAMAAAGSLVLGHILEQAGVDRNSIFLAAFLLGAAFAFVPEPKGAKG